MFTEEQAFSLLKRKILIDRGLDCEQYKESYLKRRLAIRLRVTDSSDYMDYLRVLREDPDEYTHLLDELTINVTQFFRDKDVYAKIRDEVIPAVLKAKAETGSRSLRVWSAGCASGEEPYSVAILIAYRLGRAIDDWNVRVLGSDIDDKSLRLAREGVYPETEIPAGMNPGVYFDSPETGEEGAYRVRESIRKRVRFEKADILEESRRRHFDLVLCRNVLIYFSRDVQARIVRCLASNLIKGGYLVLGKSEVISREAEQPFKVVFPRERIFQLFPAKAVGPGGHR